MPNTENGLPYPAATESLRNGYAAIQALANAADRMASDAADFVGSVVIPAGQTYQFSNLTVVNPGLKPTTVVPNTAKIALVLPNQFWLVHAWVYFGGALVGSNVRMQFIHGGLRRADVQGNGYDMLSLTALIVGGGEVRLDIGNGTGSSLNCSDGRICVARVG